MPPTVPFTTPQVTPLLDASLHQHHHILANAPINKSKMIYAQPQAFPATPTVYEHVGNPGYVYPILITGMVIFMASNVMPNLLPEAQRIMAVAPFLLQWGFMLLLFAIMAQWTRLLPGVTSMQITWVNMTIAFLLFFLIWNQMAADIPEPAPEKSSSSSSSASRESSKGEEKKEKKEKKEAEPSPWEEMRAHPSAFLTTRLNRMIPWPFPMGRAAKVGNELWWESGVPSQVGHLNRPPEDEPADKEAEKKKKELEQKEKEKKEKEKAKAEAQAKAEKEAAELKKRKEDEIKRQREMEKAKTAAEAARKRQAVEQRHKQKLWRTKSLAMIVAISFLNRVLAFGLLLLFSLQLLSQELNKTNDASGPSTSASASSTSPSGAESRSSSSSRDGKSSSSALTDDERKQREKALAEREAAKAKAGSSSKTSSSSSSGKLSSSSSSKDKSSSSSSSGSTRSSSSKDPKAVTGDAVREASGSKTVTGGDAESGEGQPPIGFGMHYIHTMAATGGLDKGANQIPSEGMAHPLMTSLSRRYAN